MIKLFVTDIDGCIAEPYQPYDLEALRELARLAGEAGLPGETARPAVSLCSGRSYAYVEAVSQMLGLRTPVLFESGGGLFDPVAARVTWSPGFTDVVERQLDEIAAWIQSDVLPGTSIMLDHGKRTQCGIVATDPDELQCAMNRVRERVASRYPDLIAFDTPVSVDIVAAGVTKKHALEWLVDRLDMRLDEVAFIGDTNGDLPALDAVGHPFAPANAVPEVLGRVDYVTDASVTRGVLEAYYECLRRNARVTALRA